MIGGGLSTVLGDADLDIIDWYSYGYSLTARYIQPFKKTDRWNITFEYTYSSMTQQGYITKELYRPSISQNYIGAGCRFYLFNTIKEYNPYFMEFLPFLEASGGLLTHSMSFAEPYANSNDNYELTDGSYITATVQLTGGALLVLSQHWALEGFIGFRFDPTDKWDGLKNPDSLGDVFVHGGIGINYAL